MLGTDAPWTAWRRWLLVVAGVAGLVGFVLEYGTYEAARLAGWLALLRGVAVGGFLLEGALAALTIRPWRVFFSTRWPLLVLAGLLLCELGVVLAGGEQWLAPFLHFFSIRTAAQAYVVLLQLFIVGNLLAGLPRISARVAGRRVRPMVMFLAAFALAILVGGAVLTLPRAAPPGAQARFLDATFTSTSAVCVTGLAVRDTGTQWTRLGQWTILLLIQLGGLGIMSVTAALALLLGRGLGLREGSLLREIFQIDFVEQVGRNMRFIALFTAATELLGAMLLFVGFRAAVPHPATRAFTALFHAVSAFCNAGFSTFPDNLCSFTANPLVYLTVAGLLIVGGIGFPVAANVLAFARGRALAQPGGQPRRLTVQTRVVLRVTALLLGGGTLLLALLEWNGAFAGQSAAAKVGMAFFQAATPRTAGFNTVDIARLSEASLLLQIVLMFIGASSASTGGGIKVTTLAVIWANLRAIATGHPQARLHDREISQQVGRQATFVFLANLFVGTLGTFLLLLTDGRSALVSAYEVYSALGTVGLSVNLTPSLSDAGKLIIIVVMFFGRVGPLAVAYGIVRPTRERGVRLPASRIMIG
ncbi:MAG: potassium transporter TrkG [Candidatus Krumholzibacteriia bacterium]